MMMMILVVVVVVQLLMLMNEDDEDELYDIIKMMLLQQTIFNSISIYAFLVCACLLIIVFAFYHDISLYDMKRYDIT